MLARPSTLLPGMTDEPKAAGRSAADPLSVLVVSPMLYHPGCGNGGGVVCFELLRRLAGRASVHFIGFSAGGPDEGAAMAALNGAARSVRTVPLPRPLLRGWLSAVAQLLTGVPREVRDLRSARMHALLAQRVADLRPDVVLLQFPHMAQYVDAVGATPTVVDVQDACLVSRYREWRAARGVLRRPMRLHTWLAWSRYELRHYARAGRLMALSDNDLGVLRAYLPGVPAFLSGPAWEVRTASPAAIGERVLFMGNFAHAPNVDGLDWMLSAVWPLVRRSCPRATLQVAGANLPTGFASDSAAGVESMGFVPEVGGLLDAAALSVVPYRFGGGVKIKTLESMARGCPVVATRVGSEGLGVVDGVHLRVADGTEDFAAAIVALLQAPSRRHALADAARALVAARFSWDRKVDALLGEFRGLVLESGRAAATAPP